MDNNTAKSLEHMKDEHHDTSLQLRTDEERELLRYLVYRYMYNFDPEYINDTNDAYMSLRYREQNSKLCDVIHNEYSKDLLENKSNIDHMFDLFMDIIEDNL